MHDRRLLLVFLVAFLVLSDSTTAQSWVNSVSPSAFSATAARNAFITVVFSRAIAPQSLTAERIGLWADQSGRHSAAIVYDELTRTLTIDPSPDFFAGERVDVTLERGILSAEGEAFSGYSFSFIVRSADGSGSFDARSESGIGPNPVQMLAHDFDRDGTVDVELIDENPSNNRIFLLRHPGSGPWALTGTAYLGWPPVSLTVADVNNDSESDYAVTKQNDELTIVKRVGGSYNADTRIPVGFSASEVKSADLNNDGAQDLIVARAAADHVLVLMNSGNGSFNAGSVGLFPVSPSAIVPLDVDLDGDIDLLIAQRAGGSARVYLNDGEGGFSDSLQVPAGIQPRSLAAGDLDGDGKPDFVVADSSANNITIVQNNGASGFSSIGTLAVNGAGPAAVLLSDFDGDRDLDIATMNTESKSFSIFRNNGHMAFSRLAAVSLEYHPRDCAAVDWDFDGDIDLFAVNRSTYFVSILVNRAGVPRISLPSSTVDFGGSATDTLSTREVWVHNIGGNSELSVQIHHEAHASFVLSPDSLKIAADDSARFVIGFNPELCSRYVDSLTLMHNDPLSSPLVVHLIGYGSAVRRTDPAVHWAWSPGPCPVALTFGEPMNPATVAASTVFLYGSRSGRHFTQNLVTAGDMRSATFEIDGTLIAEEDVTITVTTGLQTARGTAIIAPYSWSFRVRASSGTGVFGHTTVIDSVSLPTRVVAGDFQNDGIVDLVVASPSTVHYCPATETGWTNTGGPGGGGASVGDVLGNRGVGVISGTWTDAVYSWWVPDSQQVTFLGSLADFPFGSGTTDVDGDGDLDVLFSTGLLHSLTLLRNTGSPPFPNETIPVDGGPIALAAGDFDRDGLLDLVVSTNGRDAVAFCRNLGEGTFEVIARPFVGMGPLPLAVADYDGDGLTDVAVGAQAGQVVSVLLNKGNFRFSRIPLAVPGRPRSLVAADFNSDGRIDLAAAIEDAGLVIVWANNGPSGFSKILERRLGSVAYGVEAVDQGRGGTADLVVTFDSYIALIRNKKPEPDIEVLPSPVTFPSVEVGGTRSKSLVVRNAGGEGTLQVTDIRVSGSAFSLSASTLELPVGASQQISLHFNPVGPHRQEDSIRLSSNDPDTPVLIIPVVGFGCPVVESVPAQNGFKARSGDSIRIDFTEAVDPGSIGSGSIFFSSQRRSFDRNILPFLASTSGKSLFLNETLSLLAGEQLAITLTSGVRIGNPASASSPYTLSFRAASTGGTGVFEPAGELAGPRPNSPTFLDVDADGDLDIAYSGFWQNEVFIYRNNGAGTYAFSQRIWPVVDPGSIAAADFDCDGDLDLAVSQTSYTDAITLLRNDGKGQFAADEPIYLSYTPGLIIAADQENDGDADLILTSVGYIIVLENDGAAGFTQRLASQPAVGGLQAVADFDNDGFLDVCVTDYSSGRISVFSYEGMGVYQLRHESNPGWSIHPATLGDFDGDRLCDIVVGGTDDTMQDAMMILRNDGNWGFPLHSTVPITSYPYGLGVGDLDGDGDLDLVSANTIDAKATVATNDGSGHFGVKQTLGVAAEPSRIDIGDCDQDGDLDLLIGAYAGGRIHLLKNGLVVSAPAELATVPKVFSLDQNFPNPFNPTTTIRYGLPCRSKIRLSIFNAIGQELRVLEEQEREAGFHEVKFEGGYFSSGVYFYRLKAQPLLLRDHGIGDFVQTRKLLLLR